MPYPCLRISRPRMSRPAARSSLRETFEKYERILLRAEGVFTSLSQSREGVALFCVRISTRSPVLQLVGQRHDGAVDLRAHAVVAHLGVDVVGEVHGRGAGAQAHDLALRREHEHLGRRQVHLERLQELARVLRLVLPVHHLAQPGKLLVQACVGLARSSPCSASAPPRRTRSVRCISSVRICTSSGRPAGPMTVVWRLWYMLNFGMAM